MPAPDTEFKHEAHARMRHKWSIPSLGIKGQLSWTMNSLDTFLWPVVLVALAGQKLFTKFLRVSSKLGVAEADENSSWPLFNFLFAAKYI